MLQASDLTKAYDGAPLFDGLSFVLGDGERAGLVGPNGVGKSTLLRLLAGVDRPDRGSAGAGSGERIGWLAQEAPDASATLGELLGAGLGEVWAVRAELRALEARLAAGDSAHDTLQRYGHAQSRFDALGGWALEASLDEARRALAIDHLDPSTPLGAALGRRAGAGAAGGHAARGADGAAARRADQPPRRRRAGVAGAVAAGLRRDGRRRLPRPRLPRRRRRLHPRARARWCADPLRGRLQRSSRASASAGGRSSRSTTRRRRSDDDASRPTSRRRAARRSTPSARSAARPRPSSSATPRRWPGRPRRARAGCAASWRATAR